MPRIDAWTMVAALAAALALGACSRQETAHAAAPDTKTPAAASAADAKPAAKDAKSPAARPMEPAPVHVAIAKVQSVPIEVETFGAAEAVSSVEIKAQVSGQLTKVSFREGDAVAEGQELFTIDPRPYQAALDAASANAARAEAQLAQAKSDLVRGQVQEKSAQTEFGRNKTLLDRGMVTKAEYDQTVVGVESSRAMVAANQAAVRSGEESARAAQAAIESAKLDLEHCVIRAPLTGRTGSLLAHQGSIIKANDTGPMLVITQTKPIYVSFTLAERYLDDVRARHSAGKVEVRAAAPGQEAKAVKGELTFIDNIVDRQTSTIRLKAAFANENEELWPGQYVKATIVLGESKDAVVVPAQAVQTSQKGIFVYVVGPNKKAELRLVKTGVTYRDLIVVAEGLKPEETVVSEGHLRVAPGGPLNILDGTPGESERPREPQSVEPAKP